MKSFLLRFFTWWNGQTFGTQFWTWLYGEFVGEDEFEGLKRFLERLLSLRRENFEAAMRAILNAERPGDGIVGEEFGS